MNHRSYSDSQLAAVLRGMPAPLRDVAGRYWEEFLEASQAAALSPPTHPELLSVLMRVWAYSEFVARSCIADPAMLLDLTESGDLLIGYQPDEYRRRLHSALLGVRNDEALGGILRGVRRREMVRIAWRDLAGWAPLAETLGDLSGFADACLDGALKLLHLWQMRELGEPRSADGSSSQSMVVLGMGKLGARELNFSSDIDLIFAFPEEGETRGRRRHVDNDQYFARLAQRLIKVIDTPNVMGRVFRVDMRLRPYGGSGPLAMSFAAMEDYYESQGRQWERYAMVKARPVAGDLESGERLLSLLRPFVYRRYIDFGSLESLREMKAMISREVERKGLRDNIKLGPGGIREIEFIGQAFQLIRGGREPELQERGILPVLRILAQRGHMPEYAAHELSEAYLFLRRVENRLQAVSDGQTHDLPGDNLNRTRLASAMGYHAWPAFQRALEGHRRRVQDHFEQLIAAPQMVSARAGMQEEVGGLAAVWGGVVDNHQAREILNAAGYTAPREVQGRLEQLRQSYACRAMSAQGRARIDHLMPLLLGAVGQTDSPERLLMRVLSIIEATLRRSAYLALLLENPLALSQLVKLCAASNWIAVQLARHPVLLDELLDPRTLYAPLDRTNLEHELQSGLSEVDAQDLERQMDVLRHFKQANVLRVAAADVMGVMPLMEVSDHLTAIAEVVINCVLELAAAGLDARGAGGVCHSRRRGGVRGFAIAAYGKLGGFELGYGSDLDVVFLHADGSGGEYRPDDEVYYARLGQRVIHMLNTYTTAGVLYHVDTRLRPSGASGLLVSGIGAYADYQRNAAWTWEHQALLRARVVAGDADIARRFEEVRTGVLSRERDPEQLRSEVCEMRERMHAEYSGRRAESFDIKKDPGGIMDIEFIVQYCVLRWACRNPSLLQWTDNIRLIEGLEKSGVMAAQDAHVLNTAYRAFRARVHRLALQEEPAVVAGDDFQEYRAAITRIWKNLLKC